MQKSILLALKLGSAIFEDFISATRMKLKNDFSMLVNINISAPASNIFLKAKLNSNIKILVVLWSRPCILTTLQGMLLFK